MFGCALPICMSVKSNRAVRVRLATSDKIAINEHCRANPDLVCADAGKSRCNVITIPMWLTFLLCILYLGRSWNNYCWQSLRHAGRTCLWTCMNMLLVDSHNRICDEMFLIIYYEKIANDADAAHYQMFSRRESNFFLLLQRILINSEINVIDVSQI